MQEETRGPEETASVTAWRQGFRTAPTQYVNTAYAEVGESDIALTMGLHRGWDGAEAETKPGVRLVFTHANFVKFAGFVSGYAAFLADAYGGNPPSLSGVDAEAFRQALERMNTPPMEARPVESL